MTTNQLAYQANLEKERSNRANELIGGITASANARNAETNYLNLTNLARQAEAAYMNAVTNRSNLSNQGRQAEAAYMQALSAQRNAETNYREMLGQLGRWASQNTIDAANVGANYLGSLGSVGKAAAAFFV